MRRKFHYQVAVIVLFTVTASALGWAQPAWRRHGCGPLHRDANPGVARLVSALPYEDLSIEERSALLKMREEEKLARDVYKVLYDLWGLRIFANISRSEQRHMDAIKALLNKYDLPDPANDEVAGMFSSPEMQKLYNDLTAQGAKSAVDALLVGATIEDLDIFDLKEGLKKTDNQDVTLVFQNLLKGSRNHLRAFSRVLGMFGQTYTAQYLDQDEIDAIIQSPRERGPVNRDGLPVPMPWGRDCRGMR